MEFRGSNRDSNKFGSNVRNVIYKLIEVNNDVLRLKPTWVASQNCSSGKRLGLKESEYNKEERGEITEGWITSTTRDEKDRKNYLKAACPVAFFTWKAIIMFYVLEFYIKGHG